MYDVMTIGNEMLKIAKRENISLQSIQLNKLAYIAYGFSLAILNKPLFDASIEAWKYGPVIPDLYRATKHFGRDPIPLDLIHDGPCEVDKDTEEILEALVLKYSHLSGTGLSNLTNKEGTPYKQVKHPKKGWWAKLIGNGNPRIPDSLIKKYYEDRVREYKEEKENSPTAIPA